MFAPRGAEACATSYDNWLTTGLPLSLKQPRLPPLPRSEYLATGEQPKGCSKNYRKGWEGPGNRVGVASPKEKRLVRS